MDETLRQLLNLFENALANFLFGARLKPFSQLEPDEQDAVLRRCVAKRLQERGLAGDRSGYTALRRGLRLAGAAVAAGDPARWPGAGLQRQQQRNGKHGRDVADHRR